MRDRLGCKAYFNPRPPRGGRPRSGRNSSTTRRFQSTPSARRATPFCGQEHTTITISIHALREEGDDRQKEPLSGRCYFNPRPPRGGRPGQSASAGSYRRFQSTPSARRATNGSVRPARNQKHFNPRPPRGGRPSVLADCTLEEMISIHALREEGDRSGRCTRCRKRYFNPRPPRGGRLLQLLFCLLPGQFQSTPSARRAT